MTKAGLYQPLLALLLLKGCLGLFGCLITLHAQSSVHIQSPAYSFIVAGHVYGSHEREIPGLHPPFLASLEADRDSLPAFAVFTGDIVHHSNEESWEKVEMELDSLNLPTYFVMGNHDMNYTAQQVFLAKHGGSVYAFRHGRELFVVLNSTEADRAISASQLAFLEEQLLLTGDSTRSVFIFFHEIIWNSLEKYMGVRSNSRSRYDQVKDYSNYWEEVHPLLTAHPELPFYLIAGDMGANPDAVAAFYERWDNVTLIGSGMGEVAYENYLLVRVDSLGEVRPELVALDPAMVLPPLEEFSVPPAPDSITGPGQIIPGSGENLFEASEIPGATAFSWELPPGLTGVSMNRQISLDADNFFLGGMLKVRAERDGFGWGPEAMLFIDAVYPLTDKGPGVAGKHPGMGGENGLYLENRAGQIVLTARGLEGDKLSLEVYDSLGRLLHWETYPVHSPHFAFTLPDTMLPRGSRYIRAASATAGITAFCFYW